MQDISSLRPRARSLRQQGYTYSEISDALDIAKSTAHKWANDIVLSSQAHELLAAKISHQKTRNAANLTTKRIKLFNQRNIEIKTKALDIVRNTNLTANHNRLLCAILYWCEGEKAMTSGLAFINSDPKMVQTYLRLLREGYGIQNQKLRAIVHLHDYHDVTQQLNFWSNVTGIPMDQFYPPYIKPHTGKNKHSDYPGCISIRYRDAALGRLIKEVYLEYASAS